MPDALLALAESVADGGAIDWVAAEEKSPGDDRALVRQLRVIAELATIHRTLPADPAALPSAFAARRTAASPAIGRWAHLDLIERLGGGTFGDVYRAFDRHLEREVALKVLHGDVIPAEDVPASRALGEGRLHARLKHPNIVTVYGAAVHDGRFGLWMELVNGSTLEQLIVASGPMSASEAAVVGIDLCRAVAALHAAGLLHRDIKTQNAMREEGGRIVLMDFGTSRVVDPLKAQPLSDLAGTPLYLAPEVFDGQPATLRSDIYSLGVLLYRLVTCAFPVPAKTLDELREAHAARRVVRLRDARPDLPGAFLRVVERALAVDPTERYATAGELEADLLKSRDEQVLQLPAPQPVGPSKRRRAGTWLAAATVVVATIAASALALSRFGLLPEPRSGAVPPGAIRSIAVLPLANLSGDSEQDYFADGMTDELIAKLGQLGGVNVISRTSVMQFRGARKALPEIAKALHVDAILEGSVLGLHDPAHGGGAARVRINARLIYAGTDTQVWDRTFESVVDDVLALQGTVARAVAQAVHTGGPAVQTTTHLVNPQAYDWYLRGRYLWNKRTPEDLRKALDAFRAAVEVDPNSAEGWSGLADAYLLLANQGEMPPAEVMPRAKAAARRALELNSLSAEAHASLAMIAFSFDWDTAAANAEFVEAITLNPSYATARTWHGLYLAYTGHPLEAVDELTRARALDPLAIVNAVNIARCYYFARDYRRAMQSLEDLSKQEPNVWMIHAALGQTYIAMGDYEKAVGELNRARELSPSSLRNLAVLADAYGRAGRRGDALSIARQLAELARTRYVPPAYRALVNIGLGDHARALEYLQSARDERSEWITQLAMEPEFDPLREDPEFVQLLAH